jgi:hypothetical protein
VARQVVESADLCESRFHLLLQSLIEFPAIRDGAVFLVLTVMPRQSLSDNLLSYLPALPPPPLGSQRNSKFSPFSGRYAFLTIRPLPDLTAVPT